MASSSQAIAIDSDPESSPSAPCITKFEKDATALALEELKVDLDGYQATAAYCLGGSLPVSRPTPGIPSTCGPVTIRFDISPPILDEGSPSVIHKIVLPLTGPCGPSELGVDDSMINLLEACTPATFGYLGIDVLDENYREAGKLDKESFSTNWNPYDCGIVDAIAQTLLPSIGQMVAEHGVQNVNADHLGVLAELYKLNVYSGPSGKFHKHVDTPRGAVQFGSLVVCLPHPHQGGQLRAAHKGGEKIFDWSNTDANAIKWAAFYSDCEHEVLQVTSGHRVTLTYNLYVSEHVGGILQQNPTADPALYPLFEKVKKMLEQPGFMTGGGTLGFFCGHRYAHTSRNTEGMMPYALKGIDAVLFVVFRALGIQVTVQPILEPKFFEEYELNRYENGHDEDEIREVLERSGLTAEQVESRLPDALEEAGERQLEASRNITRAGVRFFETKFMADLDEGEDPKERIGSNWPYAEFKNVVWLNNETKHGRELAMVNLKYGNQAELDWTYSHAAILVHIPSKPVRQLGKIGTSTESAEFIS